MSIDLTGTSAEPPPPPDRFAHLAPVDRHGIPDGVVDAGPLTEAQSAALARMLAAPAPATGHRVAVLRRPFDLPFDPGGLRRALDALSAAHDTLRTSFAVEGGREPLRLVHAEARISLSVHDLRGLDAPRLAAARTAHENVEREVPLPSSAPALRLTAQLEGDTALRLVLTYSPALLDAPGAADLLAELFRIYDGASASPGEPYGKHAAAERGRMADPRQRDHWSRVVDAHAPLLLPDGWGTPNHTGHRHRVHVPFGDLADGLGALADRAGTSAGTVLLAAHLSVLAALTPDAAFHTGVLYDGRPEAPLALGVYRDTVPFPHARTAGTWRQLVAAVHRRCLETEPYARHPWAAVRRAARIPGRFADVVFDPAPAAGPDQDGAHFPLAVRVLGDSLLLDAAHEALDEEHAGLLARIYREVLTAMAADPEGDAAANRLPASLARDVLDAGSSSGPGRTAQPLLPELVAARAAETPDATAVVAGETALDFRTLDGRANRIAHRIRELGVGQGDLVAVLLRRSPDLLPALLGVLRSGAAYVPLDPGGPAERLAHILTVTDAPLILIEEALAPKVPGPFTARAVALDAPGEAAALARQGTEPPISRHGPDDLAYVIFTSGSTGTPKGVMVGHGALAGLLHSFAGLTGDWLAATSVSFDISGLELYLPLITGGTVVLADDAQAKDPVALLRLIDTGRVTHVQATPSGWRLLVAAGLDAPGVAALVGGEELPARLADELRPRVGTLTNVYGPTETTIWSASWPVPHGAARVALGDPLVGETLHVLDQALEPVPPGVAGELCIGGSGVVRGYHRRPALTADRFVPDPHGQPGARLYRTGDLARRNADGSVEFLGRIDTQVKVSGHRIELGEIRAALTSHPAVRDAVVVVREPSPGIKRLLAYIVTAGRTDAGALRRHLMAKLPDYMIPAAFVAIPRIPLSISGKVDLGALPAPRAETDAARHPVSATEARVAALCAEFLGLRGLGPDDNLLQRGAQSLSLVQLLVHLRREYAIDSPLSVLLERLTISGLSDAVLAADRAPTTGTAKPHRPRAVRQ